jgi:valyl-tRNA synthetase
VNKLYNATRFVLMTLSPGQPAPPLELGRLTLEDQWILSRLSQTIAEVTEDYERYRVAELSQTLYRFLWNEVCDWYLEAVKHRLYNEADPAEKSRAQGVLVTVLDAVLRLLHPCMPFVTEELWRRLPGKTQSIMKAAWPKPTNYPVDENAVTRFEFLKETVTAVRTSRSELNIPPSGLLKLYTKGEKLQWGADAAESILLKSLARVVEMVPAQGRPPKTALAVVNGGEIYIHLEGLIDLKAEAAKQQKERAKLENYVKSIEAKLSNQQFVQNAPSQLVEGEKTKLSEAKEKIARIEGNLSFLES